MYQHDLTWRLDLIHAELDNLPMFAAAWQSMTNQQRVDVRSRWHTLVCAQVTTIWWRWRVHSRGEDQPEWWLDLCAAMDENAALIEFMELPMPRVAEVPARR